MQLNLYSSVPATQSFIHPASTKNIKSMGMKFNSPLTPSPGLNPSGSSKNIQDVTSSFPNNCQSPFLLSQNSEKKLKMPFGEGNKKWYLSYFQLCWYHKVKSDHFLTQLMSSRMVSVDVSGLLSLMQKFSSFLISLEFRDLRG